jgi:hypothetical protein
LQIWRGKLRLVSWDRGERGGNGNNQKNIFFFFIFSYMGTLGKIMKKTSTTYNRQYRKKKNFNYHFELVPR